MTGRWKKLLYRDSCALPLGLRTSARRHIAFNIQQLRSVKLPTLMISGGDDDVINYHEEVRWIFDTVSGVKRHLLTYEKASASGLVHYVDSTSDAFEWLT